MSLQKEKRERSTNFTPDEKELLVEIALQYVHIIENKKTDAVSSNRKEETWDKITKVFNDSSDYVYRTPNTLKLKYIGLKKELVKKQAEEREQLMKGGRKRITYCDLEFKLMPVINCCFSNQTSLADSDNSETTNSFHDTTNNENEKKCFSDQNSGVDQSENEIEVLDVTPDINEMETLTANHFKLSKPFGTMRRENRVNKLAETRNELVLLQMQILKEEHQKTDAYDDERLKGLVNEREHKTREHNLRMKMFELEYETKLRDAQRKDEEHVLKMKILQIELQQKQFDFDLKTNNTVALSLD